VAVLADGLNAAGDYTAHLPGALGKGMYIIQLTVGLKKVATLHVGL